MSNLVIKTDFFYAGYSFFRRDATGEWGKERQACKVSAAVATYSYKHYNIIKLLAKNKIKTKQTITTS